MSLIRCGALAASLVAAVALYVVGHGLYEAVEQGHASPGHAIAGLCLVLFAALAPFAAVPTPRARRPLAPPPAGPAAEVAPAQPPAASRASPAWLQRFLA